jgi:hypothetical protein
MEKTLLLNLALVLFITATAPAETRLVPHQYATIQAAIDNCNNGDVVIVAPGTYTGKGNRDIDFCGKAITIRSTDPNDPNIIAATIINCDGTIKEPHRGFKFVSGEGPNSVIAGLTITNGYGPQEPLYIDIEWYRYSAGGAIFCEGSSPTIDNCSIIANSATAADGICCVSSSPLITNCSIIGDPAHNTGGGIYLTGNSSALISNCIIMSNKSSGRGGGIFIEDSTPKIEHCLIEDNSAVDYGGGIYTSGSPGSDSSPVIIYCTFLRNSTTDKNGGAICSFMCSPTISHCTIVGNSAPSRSGLPYLYGLGGGICCGSGSEPKISQCVITGNFAGRLGGGIFCSAISGNITNCTITGNSAARAGGGFYYQNTNFTTIVRNCILWSNTAPAEPQIGGTSTVGGPIISYNNVQGGYSGEGNINTDPLFADPESDDYHLKSQAGRWDPNSQSWVQDDVTSPCIDAGDPSSPINLEPFPNGGVINMGAYGGTAEVSKSYFGQPVCETIVAGDINGDCKVDFLDFGLMAFHWLENNNAL